MRLPSAQAPRALWRLCLCASLLASLIHLAGAKRPRPDADVPSGARLPKDFLPYSDTSAPADDVNVARSAPASAWAWDSYHDEEEAIAFLADVADASGGVCKLQSIGESVQGRRIVAVVATAPGASDDDSSKAGTWLPKANFVWIGNMHGDETANRELLLRLAAGLCSGSLAAEEPRWGALLGKTVVHIIPSMNPDGYAGFNRMNANGVDLNRNFFTSDFPYAKPPAALALVQLFGQPLYPAASVWAQVGNYTMQPEAQAVASYLTTVAPELSLNLHGGSTVANYLMDACDSLGVKGDCPSRDEPVPALLAQAYASLNPAMAASRDPPFANGTVRGSVWYTVLGSLQDWVYYKLHRVHMTLELHDIKHPPAPYLLDMWDDNRDAMLRIMELAHMGLRARVVDDVTRRALSANLTVTQPAGVAGASASASADGYLYKAMYPGVTYEFVVWPYDPAAPRIGYDPITLKLKLPGLPRDAVWGEGLQRTLCIKKLLTAARSKQTRKLLAVAGAR